MIQRLSHVTIYTLNQEESLRFYRDKLGFKVHTDVTMEHGFRWLTLTAPGDPDLELVLMEPKESPMMDAETAGQIRELVKKGALGAGVFNTADCRKTSEELKGKGVEFVQEPTDEFYGVQSIIKDNSGNVYSLTQPK
jgi:catechol 2,3-dioxygenase-like lactoylglutathione lyase family enzyme